jgi:hypothetical protein
MRVKIVNPDHAAGLIDPQTRRSPFLDPEGKVIESADVPETSHWVRRLRAGEVARVESTKPVGDEPIKPLTTR